jgi:hypothetical protein
MIGIVLLIIAIPMAVAAFVYGDYGAAAAAGAGLGALIVTALLFLLPFVLLVRAKRREAQGQAPLEWIDEEPGPNA